MSTASRSPTPSAGAKGLFARVALLLTSLALALVGAELVYRLVAPSEPWVGGDDEWTLRYRHMNETIYMRSSIEGLVYEPRPSSRVEMEYGVAGFDAARRRWDGQAVERTGARGRVQVALVGDSLAWSEFVSVSDSLAVQTEAALGSDGYQVSNFGVSGYDTREEALYYRARVRPHAPDVVVVVYCLNDLFLASGPWGRFATDGERTQKDRQDAFFDARARVRRETLDAVAQREEAEALSLIVARLRAMYRRATFEDHYVDEYTIAIADDAHLTRMRRSVSALGAAIRADGAEAILVISPMLESWDAYRWSRIHDLVREAAERAGFTVHDPLDSWRGSHRPEELRSSGDNIHYGARGNQVFGQLLADAVRGAMVD